MNSIKATGFFGGALAALSAWFAGAPDLLHRLLEAVVLLIVADTISGWYLSARAGQAASFTLRTKLAAKLLQYWLILIVCFSAARVGESWHPLVAGLGGLCVIEVHSIFENLSLLEQRGGVKLKTIRPLLRWIGQSFAVVQADAMKSKRAHEEQTKPAPSTRARVKEARVKEG